MWHKRLKNQPVRDDDDIEVHEEVKFISAVSSFSVVVQDVHLIVTAADCSGVSVSPLQKIKVEKT